MTGPFSPRISEALEGSIRHEVTVFAVPRTGPPFPLDITRAGLSVTFAEDWSPYAQVTASAVIPESQEYLDALDPRLNCRLRVDAGYTFPDDVQEVFSLADVGLRKRPVARPAGTMALTADSAEFRTQDRRIMYSPTPPKTGVNQAARWLLGFAFENEPYTLVSSFADGYGASALADWGMDIGDDFWTALADMASRAGVRIFCDESKVWRIVPRADGAGPVRHAVATGQGVGTITATNAELSREDWFNAAVMRYRWTDATNTARAITGTATANSGPYTPALVGRRVYLEDVDKPVSQATADAVAATRVKSLITRGRTLSFTAVAAYWLRPGHTIQVTLPTGSPELAIIRSITFRPLDGLMDITTRQPSNTTTKTGE